MWKQVGAAKNLAMSTRVSKSEIDHYYSRFTPRSLIDESSPSEKAKENDQKKFCSKYFKSVEKSRLDGSRVSQSYRDKLVLSTVLDKQRKGVTPLKSEGNDSIMFGDRENQLGSERKDMSPKGNQFRELIQEVKRSRHNFPVKNPGKMRALKMRVSDVKTEYKSTRQFILKEIFLFKNQLNKVQNQISNQTFSSGKQTQNVTTATSIPSESPKKGLLNLINQEIGKYNKSMTALEKRKQEILILVNKNQASRQR